MGTLTGAGLSARPRLTDDQMVQPKAIAPFEAAKAFELWAERARADADAYAFDRDLHADDEAVAMTWAGGLGVPCPMKNEPSREFGQRCAVALFTLIKEI